MRAGLGAVLTAAVLGAMPGAAVAQGADTTNQIDRIVAVVGARAITASQLLERVNVELQGREAPTDPRVLQQLHQTVLAGLVDEELVVRAALADTMIKVTDEEVTRSVDELYRNIRSRLGTEEKFREQLLVTGFQTLEEWRSFSADQQRRRFLYERFWQNLSQQGKVKDVPPTDREIRDYFDQNKASFPPRSEAVSFDQIVVVPVASEPAKAEARRVIDSILVELRAGADFATAARRFSMDPGTREQGGSLNWIRRGQGYDPMFEAAAFSLKPGQISNPVLTSFGYHLIQVERQQPAEISVRHILIMPEIDSVQADSTRRLAEGVYRAIKAGAAFDSLQRIYHDRNQELDIDQIPLDQLAQRAPQYAEALRDVPEGDLAPMLRLESAEPNRASWAIVRLTKRVPAGEVRFEDVRDQIRARLAQLLGRRKHLERLRQATFVEIRES